jgi:branched-chain amino acid transport system ATP-binding protein
VTALLTITGLTHTYGDLTALDAVTLHVPEAGRHALLGANGAGKTTLLGLVAGTIGPPQAGRITFDGRDITRLDPARRARLGIGRTFQTTQVVDTATAVDNMVLAGWRHTGRRAEWGPARYRRLANRGRDILADLGLAGCADQPAAGLAHGQRRLLELGLVLAGRPRLLLLDEPAAGLTPDDHGHLLAALRGLPPQVVVLLVDHHLSIVQALGATVTVLRDGRTVLTGPVDEVLADPAFRDAYLRTATVVP